MKCQSFQFFAGVFALTFTSGLTSLYAVDGAALDTGAIETITGLKGVSNQTEGTFKISKPRNDVAITVEQVRMAPFMGLSHGQPSLRARRIGSWSWVIWSSSRMK